jgi:DNA repair protein RecO (recombination protein O)
MSTSARSEHSAFLLHATPYSETSLVVDLFSREAGRVAALAKGAKRRGSGLRAVLMQFYPLTVSWSGRSELRTLVRAEWAGGLIAPQGEALLCAFYMNELIVRLLPREDPHPMLFDGYVQALTDLGAASAHEETLRRFEWLLLREIGYAPDLERDAGGEPIRSEMSYRWQPEAGFSRAEPGEPSTLSGATLLGLRQGRLESAQARAQAKYLTRAILGHHLEGRLLHSRQILIDLHKL